MPRTNKILQSLNKGELDPRLDMRIDQQAYQMGCRTMENFFPLIYGGAERRPGSFFAAETKESIAKGASADSVEKVRSVEFVFSVDLAYVLEIGNQYIRVFTNSGRFTGVLAGATSAWIDDTLYYAGDQVIDNSIIYTCLIGHTSDNGASGGVDGFGDNPDNGAGALQNPTQWAVALLTSDSYPIYEVPTPYLTADLFQLKFEQSADVMFITHPSYEPRKLSRIRETTFVLEESNFQDGPFQTVNSVSTAILTPTATTGSITLTASGTNADGSTFQPFKTGTTAGHMPSGTTGGAAVGTSQTLKSITGALFKIVHAIEAESIKKTFTSPGSSESLLVYKGVSWDYVTRGTWSGTQILERSYDRVDVATDALATWETIATVSSEANNNVAIPGDEEIDDAYYRMTATEFTSGSSNVQFSVRDSSHIGVVEIVTVNSTIEAVCTVVRTLGSTDGTHRWSEGHWSNFRGWPNAVAISPEERLTFGGSASFPLTTWGSKSGDFTNMTEGLLDDDAIVLTLIGTGNQNTIRWLIAKDALLIGTYGGEHALQASNIDEALTPTNIKAPIQSAYGSEDVQPMLVGNAVLFVQRGGRRLREMVFKFEKGRKGEFDAEDLTVFANHITESTITDMAYQRTPDPAVWCVRNDGVIAFMSYERAQDVWSWCRFITSDNTAASVYESVCVIPSGSEEDQIWCSVKREIGGFDRRFLEYMAPRAF